MSGRTPVWMSPAVVVESMMLAPGDHLRISPAVAGARLIGSLGYAVLGRVGILQQDEVAQISAPAA